jgi:hypothetical protein
VSDADDDWERNAGARPAVCNPSQRRSDMA